MSRLLVPFVCLSILGHGCATDWEEIVAEPNLFSIRMPGTPARSESFDETSTRGQRFKLDVGPGWLATMRPERALIYWAAVEDLPSAVSNESVLSTFARQRAKDAGFAAEADLTPIEYRGLNGVELHVESDGVQLRTRVFVVAGRVHVVDVMGSERAMTNEIVTRYFGSLRIPARP